MLCGWEIVDGAEGCARCAVGSAWEMTRGEAMLRLIEVADVAWGRLASDNGVSALVAAPGGIPVPGSAETEVADDGEDEQSEFGDHGEEEEEEEEMTESEMEEMEMEAEGEPWEEWSEGDENLVER